MGQVFTKKTKSSMGISLDTSVYKKIDPKNKHNGISFVTILAMIIFRKVSKKLLNKMRGKALTPGKKAAVMASTAGATTAAVAEMTEAKIPFTAKNFKSVLKRHVAATGRKSGVESSIVNRIIDAAFSEVTDEATGDELFKVIHDTHEYVKAELIDLKESKSMMRWFQKLASGGDADVSMETMDRWLATEGRPEFKTFVRNYAATVGCSESLLSEVLTGDGKVNLKAMGAMLDISFDDYLNVIKSLDDVAYYTDGFMEIMDELKYGYSGKYAHFVSRISRIEENLFSTSEKYDWYVDKVLGNFIDEELYSNYGFNDLKAQYGTYTIEDFIADNPEQENSRSQLKDLQNKYGFKMVASQWIASYCMQPTEYDEDTKKPITGVIHLMFKNWDPFTTNPLPWSTIVGFATAMSKGAYYKRNFEGTSGGKKTGFHPEMVEDSIIMKDGVIGTPEGEDISTDLNHALAESSKATPEQSANITRSIIKKFEGANKFIRGIGRTGTIMDTFSLGRKAYRATRKLANPAHDIHRAFSLKRFRR